MHNVHIIALTHRYFELPVIGRFHLADENRLEVLSRVKTEMGLAELLYLSTCNRVEFLFVTEARVDRSFAERFFKTMIGAQAEDAFLRCEMFSGEDAVRHLFNVSSSLDSLVVGEREIITQVRNAYEQSHSLGLTGDAIRILIRKAIETAKAVYTQTGIANNPVSVVSLAYRRLRDLNVPLDAKFIIVGAGVTNTAMARYLKKHGYTNFVVFNRTLSKAETLAAELDGTAYSLNVLPFYKNGFSVIVTCTGSEEAIITPEVYRSLVGDDTSRKVVIDLAVPNDLDPAVLQQWDVNLIAVSNLQEVAAQNLREREKELEAGMAIIASSLQSTRQELRERQVELAMSEVPRKVKEIRDTAVNAVFAKEIGTLDEASKELLNRVLSYVEKKYISVPMKMAREILTEEVKQS
jgi:glutamyl-tRNA reductase